MVRRALEPQTLTGVVPARNNQLRDRERAIVLEIEVSGQRECINTKESVLNKK